MYKRQIPDGEIYTAPVRDSVNGVITYNTPSTQSGFTFENVCLTFENGRIVKATANDTQRVNQVFDIDEGARYVGEFAIGVNPYAVSYTHLDVYKRQVVAVAELVETVDLSAHSRDGHGLADLDDTLASLLDLDAEKADHRQ